MTAAGLPARRRTLLPEPGVARTFQAVRLFKGLSVSENLEVSLVANGLSRQRARERAKALLAEFLPGDRGRMPAAALTYGEERKVGIARAMALEPRYLLLDEPAAGMAAAEVEDLRSAIVRVRAAYGCGILVVEHNMALIFALCDRIHVLGSGRTLAVGSPDEISANTKVREAYLGAAESASA